MEKLVYIILINYNGYKDTLECIESLKNISYRNYKIIIVDNKSTDSSIQELSKITNENIILIKSDKNLGFAGGNNLGIKYALKDEKTEYILLLNNDTIVEPDFLSYLVKTGEKDKKIGLIGCKIKYFTNRDLIWYAGGHVNWFRFMGKHDGLRKFDSPKYNKEKEISFITGCCVLIKRDVIEKIGLLPEEYFMYFEDVDFCVKVKDAGFILFYQPLAVIYHKIGLSSGGEKSSFALEYLARNRLYFMFKYKNKVSRISFIFSIFLFFAERLVKIFLLFLKRKKAKVKAIIRGLKEGIFIIKKVN